MSSFTENIHIAPLPKLNLWITTKAFTYYVWSEDSDEAIEVPADFVFDGTTAPKWLWWFIQKVEPRTINPTCLHDYLYKEWRRYSKTKTEAIFYEALIACGVSKGLAFTMRLWVTIFGWWYRYKVGDKILSLVCD